MKKKICNYAGCNALIDHNERYCEKHNIENNEKQKSIPFQNANRSNANLYNTALWRGIRKEILKNTPYCFKCGISIKDSHLEIHHVAPPLGNADLFYDKNNLVVVCQHCHRIITAGEIRKRNNPT